MRKIIALLFCLIVSGIAEQSRHFTFHYKFSVRNLQPGEKIEVWFPRAASDQFQKVKVVSVQGDLPLAVKLESRFGNSFFYAVAPKATKAEYNFDVVYDVVRQERIGLPRDGQKAVLVKTGAPAQYLGPDKLVPVTGRLAELGMEQVKGKTTNMERARALYDYTFNNMRYDKSGTGWGRGDAEWACDAKRGNCTDFHSLFISMARSQKIPSRFEIGFPLPANKNAGGIAGYHCWAEFYDAKNGWVPIDISEAWKDQSKRDYFFGAHDANRVQFSVGRDIVLSPKQAGEPLNYFIYPYVEVAGKKWEAVANDFSFADAKGETSANGPKAALMSSRSGSR